MATKKMCGNCVRGDHKTIDCPVIDFELTKVDYKKLQEDANSYQNWLKFVAGRGLTDVLVEPLKVKERFDKLKKEIKELKDSIENMNVVILRHESENDNLKQKLEKIQELHNNIDVSELDAPTIDILNELKSILDEK